MRRSLVRVATLPALTALAALALAASACSGHQTVQQWAQSSGIVQFDNTISADVHGIERARKAGKPAGLIVTICDALGIDASQAYVQLPGPDQQLAIELENAYVALAHGAQNCSTSVGGSDPAAAQRAFAEIAAGAADLRAATERLASFGVR